MKKILSCMRYIEIVQSRQRRIRSGTFPKRILSSVENEEIRVPISFRDLLNTVGPEIINKFDPRKTYSIFNPTGISREEVLELFKKSSFVIEEDLKEVRFIIIPFNSTLK